ncbi:hypothetical protein [Photobacterium chitinilyticum]|uniref:Uncharacterized protein n=1 Tax=Photobacterium chitinilyticum TaxID=2485123 RepID=A0A444JI57_9GAMM|nr:hypothetical protein [Photobacterium chitinilyticum]RWX52697.1 hypothetical protein EDI28_26020 [Photobacterium chitinilyticum]
MRFAGLAWGTLLQALHARFFKVLGFIAVDSLVVSAVFTLQIESFIESAVNVPYAQCSLVKNVLPFQIHEAALLNSVLARYYFGGY